MLDGSIFLFMEEGYCVSTYEIITMNAYFKEDGHL